MFLRRFLEGLTSTTGQVTSQLHLSDLAAAFLLRLTPQVVFHISVSDFLSEETVAAAPQAPNLLAQCAMRLLSRSVEQLYLFGGVHQLEVVSFLKVSAFPKLHALLSYSVHFHR